MSSIEGWKFKDMKNLTQLESVPTKVTGDTIFNFVDLNTVPTAKKRKKRNILSYPKKKSRRKRRRRTTPPADNSDLEFPNVELPAGVLDIDDQIMEMEGVDWPAASVASDETEGEFDFDILTE